LIKGIIFDLDGTLVDSCGICTSILNEMLEDRGFQSGVDQQLARGFMSRGGQTMVSALLGPACENPDKDIKEFRDRYLEIETPESSLFPGVSAGLQALRREGYRMAICSNKPQNLCEKALRETGIKHLFDDIVGMDGTTAPKPAPNLLEKACLGLGEEKSRCYFVGDSNLDAMASEAIDVAFGFMTYGYAEADWRPQRADIFDKFPELVSFFTEDNK
jgi:phosphoglycolate phosphatase